MAAMEGGAGRRWAGRTKCSGKSHRRDSPVLRVHKPLHVRYGRWLWNVVRLDLGNSYSTGACLARHPLRFPVSNLSGADRISPQLSRLRSTWRIQGGEHGSRFDVITSVLVFLGYAVPGWALGTALLVLFGVASFFRRVPASVGSVPTIALSLARRQDPDQAYHMFLPVV